MLLQNYINTMKKRNNGEFVKVEWQSDVSSRLTAKAKKEGHKVIKRTISTVRKGVTYTHVASVRDRLISNGKYQINSDTGELVPLSESLPWGEWLIDKLVITHKDKFYARLYTTVNKPHIQYYLDGKEISQEDLKQSGLMVNSFWTSSTTRDVMTIDIDNIIKIFERGEC